MEKFNFKGIRQKHFNRAVSRSPIFQAYTCKPNGVIQLDDCVYCKNLIAWNINIFHHVDYLFHLPRSHRFNSEIMTFVISSDNTVGNKRIMTDLDDKRPILSIKHCKMVLVFLGDAHWRTLHIWKVKCRSAMHYKILPRTFLTHNSIRFWLSMYQRYRVPQWYMPLETLYIWLFMVALLSILVLCLYFNRSSAVTHIL